MIASNDLKILFVAPPGAILENATLATTEIDTLSYDYLDVYVEIGATDVAMAALKLQSSDVSGSGYVDVPGANFAGGTQPDGTATHLPSATDDNTLVAFHVKLTGSKQRYFHLVATGGNGTAGAYVSVVAVLSRPKESPSTAAGRGLAQEIYC